MRHDSIDARSTNPKPAMETHPGILISRIPVSGWGGAIFTLAVLLTFLIGMPASRGFIALTSMFGILYAGFLYYWHNQTRW